MVVQPPSPKWCHLVWTTFHRRRWFKIADAATFCERAVRAACVARGWAPDLVVALPDRVHALVHVPAAVHRRAVGPPLQRQVAEALAAARLVPQGTRIWHDGGWCAVLASPGALMVVRRQLATRAARLTEAIANGEGRAARETTGPRSRERARGIPARRQTRLEWLS